ncbi:MAG TPA: ATP-grasp domain-containing protein [Nitrososphaerales archaeon]|nr:ATP-grasp domain-containing protein [Nitrososphaerales archaeon]
MARKKVSILLTGVGAPGTRGTIYALKKNGEGTEVRLLGSDLKKDAVGKHWVDEFAVVPPPEADGYVDEVNRLCGRHGVDLVIPQTTRETMALSASLKKVKVPVAVSGGSAVRRANSKYELLKTFERLGLPHPKYFLVRSLSGLAEKARQLGYPETPVVVKPSVSFGSRGFRVLTAGSSWNRERFLTEKPSATETTLEELERILGRGASPDFPELLVSEYLPGPEYSVDAFVGRRAQVAIPRKREEIVNGISFQTTLEDRKDIAKYTLGAAKDIGLRYAFGFQFKLDANGVPKVLECNPRVQGTMVASIFSGVNVIWMAVKEALGEPPASVAVKPKAATFRRFWGGVGVSDGRLIDEI